MPPAKKPPKIGERFGHWTVIDNKQKAGPYWGSLCKCDCGSTKVISNTALRLGRSKSCGCNYGYRKLPYRTANGESNSRLYVTWTHILSRCTDPKDNEYQWYGARGIKVCGEWAKDFQAFKKWAYEAGYTDELTIDRIDMNGNYEPSNCRWVTLLEQANNRRDNVNLTYNGKTQTISMWARELGLKVGTLSWRIRKGWSVEKALNQPLRSHQIKEGA